MKTSGRASSACRAQMRAVAAVVEKIAAEGSRLLKEARVGVQVWVCIGQTAAQRLRPQRGSIRSWATKYKGHQYRLRSDICQGQRDLTTELHAAGGAGQ